MAEPKKKTTSVRKGGKKTTTKATKKPATPRKRASKKVDAVKPASTRKTSSARGGKTASKKKSAKKPTTKKSPAKTKKPAKPTKKSGRKASTKSRSSTSSKRVVSAPKTPKAPAKVSFFAKVDAFFSKYFGWLWPFGRKSPRFQSRSVISHPKLERHGENPIMSPSLYGWESQAVFNPAAISSGGRVHLFYRALGHDGVSRLGYASSSDGVNFDVRLTYPVYVANDFNEAKKHWPFTSPARLVYDRLAYGSGGGWGGCEDPRAVVIDGEVFMTFNMFNGWHSMRVAVTSIAEKDLLAKKWLWRNFAYLSRPGDRQKNWILFPEKFDGKFALFYNLDDESMDPNKVHIKYMKELSMEEAPTPEEASDPQLLPDHVVEWHNRTRSAACPPMKTKAGWLLLYHAMDKDDPGRYKLGAMLLDLRDPSRVLYRASRPILEPDAWYENDWKPGVIYASGAVIEDGIMYVYYGGGDKHIGVASIGVDKLIKAMKAHRGIKLTKRKSILGF